MKAILIDPTTQTVTAIETTGELHAMQEIVGGYIEVVRFKAGTHCFVIDEEGLLRTPPDGRRFFISDFFDGPMCGKAVIFADIEGDDGRDFADCNLSAEFVRGCVYWITEEQAERIIAARQAAFMQSAEAAGFEVEMCGPYTAVATSK